MKTIDEDQFYEIYNPVINPIERAKQPTTVADEDICPFSGCLVETFGEDYAYIIEVNKSNPNTIWVVEWDDEYEEANPNCRRMLIKPGFEPHTSYGYLVTEIPWVDKDVIVVEEYEMDGN